ncbi:MAG: hypothetical protein SXQ77_11865 [Halobacteria archaeon]|nr:hypothetical protein [Halobacteria archaeon]
MLGGVVVAYPVSSVGGFVQEFDSLSGSQLSQYPVEGNVTTCSGEVGLLGQELGSATINQLHVYKDIEFPVTGMSDQVVRLHINATTAYLSGAQMTISRLEADSLTLGGNVIKERQADGTAAADKLGNPSNAQFLITADSVDITNGKQRTHKLLVNNIVLQGATLGITFNPSNPVLGTGSCPV